MCVVVLGLAVWISPWEAAFAAEEENEELISFDQAPPGVQKAIKRETAGAPISEIEKETKQGKTVYEAKFTKNGEEYELKIAEDGEVLGLKEEDEDEDKDKAKEEGEEAEEIITLNQAPPAVQESIKRETAGQGITGIEKETKQGKTVFEAKFTKNGEEYELKVAEDGKVLGMKEEGEDHDKDKHEGKGHGSKKGKLSDDAWTSDFQLEKGELSSTGRNPYFILEPGYQLVLEGGKEQVAITVLDETKMVDGVETRVVEERETKNGQLAEVSRNYFAISKRTNGVFYFGEDVDNYKNGELKSHSGGWLAGENGAKCGLIMPGQALLGARHYQEYSPGKGMDRAEIVALNETFKTPAGEFKNCLKVEETNPLEPGEKEYKLYAPGIGIIQDEGLKLVKYGKVEGSKK
jgi:uncharacterized membrane protein YkoI